MGQNEKYELVITAENVTSTDKRFTMNNLYMGDSFKPLRSFFKKNNGEVIERKYNKGERRNSNQTLPRLAFQIFERQLAALSKEEKETFPTCRYSLSGEMIRGEYSAVKRSPFRMSGTARPRRGYRLSAL